MDDRSLPFAFLPALAEHPKVQAVAQQIPAAVELHPPLPHWEVQDLGRPSNYWQATQVELHIWPENFLRERASQSYPLLQPWQQLEQWQQHIQRLGLSARLQASVLLPPGDGYAETEAEVLEEDEPESVAAWLPAETAYPLGALSLAAWLPDGAGDEALRAVWLVADTAYTQAHHENYQVGLWSMEAQDLAEDAYGPDPERPLLPEEQEQQVRQIVGEQLTGLLEVARRVWAQYYREGWDEGGSEGNWDN